MSYLHWRPFIRRCWGAAALLCCGVLVAGVHLPSGPQPLLDRLRPPVGTGGVAGPDAVLEATVRLQNPEAVAGFYRRTGIEPNWINSAGPTALADSLIAVLRDADRDGLRPGDYHVPTLDSLSRVLRRPESSEVTSRDRVLADFELLCTDAFLLYGTHLLRGRVDPVKIVPSWTLDGRQADLLSRFDGPLKATTLRRTLHDLRPSEPGYRQLASALQRYRRIAASGGWPTVPEGPKLEEGVEGDRVASLRARLQATGDLADDAPENPRLFDASLREAVLRFQERHGLDADGVVGPASQAALNVPVEDRIEQIKVNLERWRWLPEDLGDRYVIVNIAGFHLRVMEGTEEVLEMRVVTGRPYRQTPIFSDQISYLVFSPFWHVPNSIATKDKLPAFQKNPGLVSQQGYEVFRGWAADAGPIDPSTINWSGLSASNFPYRLRQRPGAQNALGRVKFMFPNRHSVYLHDTPSRELFRRSERGFSSGCVRVERPAELAAYLLRENEGWTDQQIEQAMNKTQEQSVVLRRKVPVHLLYWTAWVEGEQVQFRRDVYQRDPGVASALAATPPPPAERSAEGGARWSP